MLIAIEGCDGAGKSTLIEQLRKNSERYFLIVRSSGYPKSPYIRERYVQAMTALKTLMDPSHVICDRYIAISEPVYGPICRQTPRWTDGEVMREMAPLDTVVYCRPPTSAIVRGLNSNEQMKGVHDHFLDIVEEYDRRMDWTRRFTNVRVIEYDYTDTEQFGSTPSDWVAKELGL